MGVEVLGNVNDPVYQEKLRAQAAAKAQAAQQQSQQQAQPLGPEGPAPEPVNVLADVGTSLGSGALRGFIGMPEAPMDLAAMVTDLYDFAQRKLVTGETREAQQARLKDADPGSWGMKPVNTDDFRAKWGSEAAIRGASEDIPAIAPLLNYAPKTWGGRIGQVAGEAAGGNVLGVPGAILKGGTHAEKVAALVKELVSQGLAPGAASEAAGQIADRYLPEQWGTAVRALTGIGTSAATGTMHNVTGPPNQVTIPGIEGQVRSTAAAKIGEGIAAQGGAARTAQELQAVGPGGRLADTGDTLRGQAEQAFIEPGASQTTIRQFLNERARTMTGGDDTHLNQALNTIVEPRAVNFAEQSQTMRQARRDRAEELYGRAREQAGDRGVLVDDFNALADRLRPPHDPTTNAPRTNYPLRDYEGTIIDTAERLRGRNDFDFVFSQKRDIDAEIRRRAVAGEHVPDALTEAQRLLDRSLENATRNPDGTSSYAAARRAYSEDSGILDQSVAGRNFFDAKETADEFRLRWRDLTPDEQTAYRMGLREAVGAKMDMAVNDFTTGSNQLRTVDNQKKLQTILGDEGAAQLQDRIDGLRRQRGTAQGIAQQSATAGRQRGRKMIEDPEKPIISIPLSRVQSPYGVASLAGEAMLDQTAGNWLRNRTRRRADESNADQARMLVQDLESLPPDQRLAMLRRLQEVYDTQGQRGLPANRALLGLQSLYQTERSEENKPPLTFSVRGRKQ